MALNAQSWEYYDQQPWKILRWIIYPSQEFHYNNIDKTMHPSNKKTETLEENNEFYANILLNQMGMTSEPSEEYINYIREEGEIIKDNLQQSENLNDITTSTNKNMFHLFCWNRNFFS